MFSFIKPKKNLDITDALIRKEAKITIGGKPVVVRAFKFAQAIAFIETLKIGVDVFKQTDFVGLNKFLLKKMPEILAFCFPNEQIDQDKITLAEFADLIMAIYCVNDLERIIANFMTAVQSMQKAMQDLATSPKQ